VRIDVDSTERLGRTMRGGVALGTIDRPGANPPVLAFHGFGATTQEVLLVVEVASRLGARVLAPLLPGHGSSVYDLAQTRWKDWRLAAQRAFDELAATSDKVIVVGSSMGSLLALDLAASHPDRVAGVAALAPAIRLGWPWPSLGLALVCGLGVPDFSIPKRHADIRDEAARATQITYEAQPAYAGNEVRLAGRLVERRLGQIRCPALVIHGQHDHVCPVKNARLVYSKLGTRAQDKQLVILPRSYHIITRDVERDIVRDRLEQFLGNLFARVNPAASEAQLPVDPYPPRARSVSERSSRSSS
jgi:carboxylesterase